MAVYLPGWITINTDAGFYKWNGMGSYAYWIRFNGQLYQGSGVFKKPCRSSTEAEKRAVLNALAVVKTHIKTGIIKIIFNRDNINVNGDPDRHHGKEINSVLREMHEHYIVSAGLSVPFETFFEFRHVKAHSTIDSKRTWVNNRLDVMCSLALREEAKRRKTLKEKKFKKFKKKK